MPELRSWTRFMSFVYIFTHIPSEYCIGLLTLWKTSHCSIHLDLYSLHNKLCRADHSLTAGWRIGDKSYTVIATNTAKGGSYSRLPGTWTAKSRGYKLSSWCVHSLETAHSGEIYSHAYSRSVWRGRSQSMTTFLKLVCCFGVPGTSWKESIFSPTPQTSSRDSSQD